jgi:hypothetical protein
LKPIVVENEKVSSLAPACTKRFAGASKPPTPNRISALREASHNATVLRPMKPLRRCGAGMARTAIDAPVPFR